MRPQNYKRGEPHQVKGIPCESMTSVPTRALAVGPEHMMGVKNSFAGAESNLATINALSNKEAAGMRAGPRKIGEDITSW